MHKGRSNYALDKILHRNGIAVSYDSAAVSRFLKIYYFIFYFNIAAALAIIIFVLIIAGVL